MGNNNKKTKKKNKTKTKNKSKNMNNNNKNNTKTHVASLMSPAVRSTPQGTALEKRWEASGPLGSNLFELVLHHWRLLLQFLPSFLSFGHLACPKVTHNPDD